MHVLIDPEVLVARRFEEGEDLSELTDFEEVVREEYHKREVLLNERDSVFVH